MRTGYARVSTSGQHTDGQETRLREAGCEVIYTDHGVTGKAASRPEWDKCLAHLRAGDVLFTVEETTPQQVERAIADAARAFSSWRATPAPVRGALVGRLGELLALHKHDVAKLVTIEAGKITAVEFSGLNRYAFHHDRIGLPAAGRVWRTGPGDLRHRLHLGHGRSHEHRHAGHPAGAVDVHRFGDRVLVGIALAASALPVGDLSHDAVSS